MPTRRLVLGPDGVGPLRLGMTRRQILETGAATSPRGSRDDGWRPGCRPVVYDPNILGGTPGDTWNGAVSGQQGLEKLVATTEMVTPEGIGVGSTKDEVRAAYDHRIGNDRDIVVPPASAKASYRILFDAQGLVTGLALLLTHLDCEI